MLCQLAKQQLEQQQQGSTELQVLHCAAGLVLRVWKLITQNQTRHLQPERRMCSFSHLQTGPQAGQSALSVSDVGMSPV